MTEVLVEIALVMKTIVFRTKTTELFTQLVYKPIGCI